MYFTMKVNLPLEVVYNSILRGEAAYFFIIEWKYMYIVTEEIKYTTSKGKILLSL
jgi:hypothetical protein